MDELKSKVILVTGGSAGIGAGVVQAFLEDGAKHVAILDVDVKNGLNLEEQLNAKHGTGKSKFYKCDVTTNELDEAYEHVLKNFGYIDVVVNNAGIMNDALGSFENMININLTALVRSSMKAYNLMRKDRGGKGGTIINISSIVALYHCTVVPIYAATKSAVLQFSSCLGMEPHYSRSNVKVLTICFGCTSTSIFSLDKMDGIDKETSEKLASTLDGPTIFQDVKNAISGFLEAYRRGSSASIWLIANNKPAVDITGNVSKGYEIMSQGVF